jgi:hypothetical protein
MTGEMATMADNPQHSVHCRIPAIGFCKEKNRLQRVFLQAIRELNTLLAEQTQAVIDGDSDFGRFDILIHMAQERKEAAKYAWIAHVETHQCEG